MAVDGECFCGAITYRVEGALIEPRCCHCSRCRKAFSGASSAYAEVCAPQFHWLTGESLLTVYGNPSVWAIGFCSVCGSTLCGFHADAVHGITLGTVNGDPGVTIVRHLFVGSRASWDVIGGTAPRFDEQAP
jgi:hypothetical protein